LSATRLIPYERPKHIKIATRTKIANKLESMRYRRPKMRASPFRRSSSKMQLVPSTCERIVAFPPIETFSPRLLLDRLSLTKILASPGMGKLLASTGSGWSRGVDTGIEAVLLLIKPRAD
jgi:hypothetical protein